MFEHGFDLLTRDARKPVQEIVEACRFALEYWRKQPTEAIVKSLQPGSIEALKVKPDGRIMNGNVRIQVLAERGFDVNSLPREVLP